jgi:hypothetical protein
MLLEMLLTFCTFFVRLKVQNPEAKVQGFRAHWNSKSTKVQKVQIIFRIIRALNTFSDAKRLSKGAEILLALAVAI